MQGFTAICTNCATKHITHDFQDKEYGWSVRYFTPQVKSIVNGVVKVGTCTVCGTKQAVK
jgi:hypothetical protein